MAMHSRSSVENFDKWLFWIRKNKCIALFNRWTRWWWSYEQNLFYGKDLSGINYYFLIKKREDAGIKFLDNPNPNAFIECSNTVDDVYKDIDKYNPSRKRKILVVFDDMIAENMTNKKFRAIIKELFFRSRKLNISHLFITRSYFSVSNDVRLNLTHYLIMKTNNKKRITKYYNKSFCRYFL